MFTSRERLLADEINKIKHIVLNPKEQLNIHVFMNAMMRGGLTEIIEHNAGKRLCFAVRFHTGTRFTLEEFYIPDNGENEGNFRGFLLSACDEEDTLYLNDTKPKLVLERELLGFFNSLYQVVPGILQAGGEIDVYLEDVA